MTLTVRAVREADAAAITTLLNEIIRTGRFSSLTREITAGEQRAFIRGLPDRAVYLAAVSPDGEILGVQDVLPADPAGRGDGTTGEISTFVADGSRGRGVGSALMNAMLPAAREQGYRKIRAVIRADNETAVSFYARHGYEADGTLPAYLTVDGRTVDGVRRTRRLADGPGSPQDAGMNLHELLDTHYREDGSAALRRLLEGGADASAPAGPAGETPLHVAARRRRPEAVRILLEAGADADARTAGGKTAYAHAVRRGFDDVADVLREHGADTTLEAADEFAVAVGRTDIPAARRILHAHPGVARTGNPEEDRLLADMAGRNDKRPVMFLIDAGAPLDTRGLDDGTPLHQAAWFGRTANARLLVAAGAPVDATESVHGMTPLGWAAHGSRHSGGAGERGELYLSLVEFLLGVGARLDHPDRPGDRRYFRAMLEYATPEIAEALQRARNGR